MSQGQSVSFPRMKENSVPKHSAAGGTQKSTGTAASSPLILALCETRERTVQKRRQRGVCDTLTTAKQTAGPVFPKLLYQPAEVTKALLSQRQGSWGRYNILVCNWDQLRGYLVFKADFLSHGNVVFRSPIESNSVLHLGSAQLTLGLSLWMFSACHCLSPLGFVDFVIPFVNP